MKKITNVMMVLLIAISMNAQTDVYLKIDHFLGSNAFAFNTTATNNLGNSFNVSRLQYYIAEIKIVHDGGQVTSVPNTWILVNANSTVNELLGSFNVTTIEAVKFGIGVEQSYNHLDPSSYAMSHPLAPKSPSMHWGWSSGYRFACLEGKADATLSKTWELHGLFDKYYSEIVMPITSKMENGDLVDGKMQGIFNYSNEGVTHWAGFAKKIFELEKINCTVNEIETKDYPTPASRPPYSLLAKGKIKETFDLEIPNWEDSLAVCLEILKAINMG